MKIIEFVRYLTVDNWQGWFVDWRGGHFIGLCTGIALGYLWGAL